MAEEQEKQEDSGQQRKRGDRWFLLIIFLLFLLGLGIRGYGYIKQTESRTRTLKKQTSPDYAQKAFPGPTGTESAKALEDNYRYSEGDNLFANLAPYLTEGGLSFFIGFCIGYFLRFVAKTMIIVVGGLYFCLILLSHYGLVTVDWGGIQELLQQLLLNTQTHLEGLRGTIAVGIPSMAMGGLGIWRGLKKS